MLQKCKCVIHMKIMESIFGRYMSFNMVKSMIDLKIFFNVVYFQKLILNSFHFCQKSPF